MLACRQILFSGRMSALNVMPVATTAPIRQFRLWTKIKEKLIKKQQEISKKSGFPFPFFPLPEVKAQDVKVKFDDVRGMDEAKHEVQEIVQYLKDPAKFTRLGARLPKGVLLEGPPGTGKTLLARAIAGEAGVPFYFASGSEFDHMFVGAGARAVQNLFERAKKTTPCIVFIDEIDTVGSKRSNSPLHPYANQTINQLLSEMDGFKQNEGVIVIGATNRVDDLDKALLRPGRFDVRAQVSVPDLVGRIDIFRLYLGKIVHEKLVVSKLAKGTTGFTGADIENVVNQAALKAAGDGSSRVGMRHLDEARDRILMGPARAKGKYPDEEANRNTAWHEAGHTLVGYYTKDAVPLHKVTIIPRGHSLGHTAFLPEKDNIQVTRSQMLAQLDVLMGGRAAEELILGLDKITTGASDDLRKATELVMTMVKRLGMSEQSGLRDYTIDVNDGRGEALVKLSDRSQRVNDTLDSEIDRMLKESYNRAKAILNEHSKEHKALAEALYEHETLTAEEVQTIINGGTIKRTFAQRPMPQQEDGKGNEPAMIEVHQVCC